MNIVVANNNEPGIDAWQVHARAEIDIICEALHEAAERSREAKLFDTKLAKRPSELAVEVNAGPAIGGGAFDPVLFELKLLGAWQARIADPRGGFVVLEADLAHLGDLRSGVRALMGRLESVVAKRIETFAAKTIRS